MVLVHILNVVLVTFFIQFTTRKLWQKNGPGTYFKRIDFIRNFFHTCAFYRQNLTPFFPTLRVKTKICCLCWHKLLKPFKNSFSKIIIFLETEREYLSYIKCNESLMLRAPFIIFINKLHRQTQFFIRN